MQNNSDELRSFCLWLVFCLVVFVGLVAGSTTVFLIQLDGMALSTSPTCGVWLKNLTRSMVYTWAQRAEEQSAIYYRNCYESAPSTNVYNLFANNEPLSTTTDNDTCPFQADICVSLRSVISNNLRYWDDLSQHPWH